MTSKNLTPSDVSLTMSYGQKGIDALRGMLTGKLYTPEQIRAALTMAADMMEAQLDLISEQYTAIKGLMGVGPAPQAQSAKAAHLSDGVDGAEPIGCQIVQTASGPVHACETHEFNLANVTAAHGGVISSTVALFLTEGPSDQSSNGRGLFIQFPPATARKVAADLLARADVLEKRGVN